MAEILLNSPVPVSDRLERLHLFPGRHLGEDEFDRLQAYTDARLAPLLNGWQAGIVRGLDVNLGPRGAESEGLVVTPGLAVAGNGQALGLFYPIRQTWQSLIDDYLAHSATPGAAGVFYLTLRRAERRIDADQRIDPCARTELDPRRDTRLVVVGSLALRRLAMPPDAPAVWTRELIENWAAASGVDGDFLRQMSNAVPLGLVAIAEAPGGGHALSWFSRAAGRYLAVPAGGYLVLLNQVQEAFERIMAGADDALDATLTLDEYLRQRLRLDFLPAAGQLPREWLVDPASATPRVRWLPDHLGIDMVPVPEESVSALIERHLPRRALDLRAPAGDRLRLLLAINEPDYRRDLLDFPRIDAVLEGDLYRYFMRAHEEWRAWKRQFDRLFFLDAAVNLDRQQLELLGVPEPVESPQRPEAHIAALVSAAAAELSSEETPDAPYPYSVYADAEPEAWPKPAEFTQWLVTPPGQSEPGPPGVEDPPANGLVIRYALTEVEIERLENQHRALQKRLEGTRDYLLLQRQQLDVQTVSLAALAGGVAGDGSGLQLARWLPFTRLTPVVPEPAPSDAGVGAAATRVAGPGASVSAGPALDAGLASAAGSLSVDLLAGQRAGGARLAARELATQKGVNIAEGFQRANFEFLVTKDRLDTAGGSSTPPSKPAYEVAKEESFGVIGRVLPDARQYQHTYENLVNLKQVVGDLFPDEADDLRARLDRIGQIKTPDNASSSNLRYQQMFKAGKLLISQINLFEARHNRLELELRGLDHELRQARARLQRLAQEIVTARRVLDGVNARRLEKLGDYGVTARLLEDDWRRVYERNEERTRILTRELRGLYFVRVRPTPVSAALPDPLALRYGKASDIVPGCDADAVAELPDELDQFFDAMLEAPVRDWRVLAPLVDDLPAPLRVEQLFALRQTRLAKQRATGAGGAGALADRLQPLTLQTHAVVQQFARAALPTLHGSLKRFNAETAQVLSLSDVLGGSGGKLRGEAQTLRQRLEQCIDCLLERLNLLAPSIRLQWAQRAEDDALPLEQVQRWPALERAERDEFNAVRTIAELVDWWFRQLDDQASAAGRSAARNVLRATLILASLGDPAEILHGQVQVPPRRLLPGEALRLTLNRRVRPGTALQLLDRSQRVVAMLNVEDQDEGGTVANIVQVHHTQAVVSTAFTVLAPGRRRARG